MRANASQYEVSPHRIGVLGFSAGGHLASTAATHFLDAKPDAKDPVERVTSRPDFAVLAYAVISMTEPFGHTGSRKNLLGDKADDELAKLLSSEKQVTEKTPPTFLFHTAEDTGVPPENSIAFFTACRKHKVPVELHVYQNGPHGVGLAPGDPALFTWKDRLHDWLRNSRFLSDTPRVAAKGKITVAGQPLKFGQVKFVPKDKFAPVAFAMVRNGNYSLDAKHGPASGTSEVIVVDLGDVAPQPTVKDATTKTPGLIVETKSGTDNQFDFDLK